MNARNPILEIGKVNSDAIRNATKKAPSLFPRQKTSRNGQGGADEFQRVQRFHFLNPKRMLTVGWRDHDAHIVGEIFQIIESLVDLIRIERNHLRDHMRGV